MIQGTFYAGKFDRIASSLCKYTSNDSSKWVLIFFLFSWLEIPELISTNPFSSSLFILIDVSISHWVILQLLLLSCLFSWTPNMYKWRHKGLFVWVCKISQSLSFIKVSPKCAQLHKSGKTMGVASLCGFFFYYHFCYFYAYGSWPVCFCHVDNRHECSPNTSFRLRTFHQHGHWNTLLWPCANTWKFCLNGSSSLLKQKL